jgi:hypothetical protein
MAGELIRPGVEVLQTTRKSSPTFVRPTLAPCVVGPAFEITNILNSDGTINSGAAYGVYSQLGKTITESSFPAPRDNIQELDVQEDSVRPFLLTGGNLVELLMGPGESFLASSHVSSRAALQTAVFNGPTGLAINGKVLVLCIDNPAGAADKSKDVTVTFNGAGNLLSSDAAAQINAAFGKTVATVVGSSPNDRVQISSPVNNYGATSSVSVRAGGSANALLVLGATGGSHDERVEGSGYRGQDDNNNDTLTPWVEFSQGRYLLDNVDTTFPSYAGLVNVETGAFMSAKASAITFGTAGTIPLQVGDYFYADGVRLMGGEVSKVEGSRFKVGTINTDLSIADSRGRYTSKVYNPTQVGTIFDATSAFAPKYAWFKATGIDSKVAAPISAAMTGAAKAIAAVQASVTGVGATISTTAMAGLTLHYNVTIDGVVTDAVFTFTGGPFTDMAAVATAIGTNIPGVTATNAAGQLKLTTVKSGRLQSITVKSDGTANALLGFSASVDTSSTGVDQTFPAKVVTSGQIATTTALTGTSLSVKISTDGGLTFPTTKSHAFAGEMASLAALVTALNGDAAFTQTAGATVLVAEAEGTELRIRSANTGAGVVIMVDHLSTSCGAATKIAFSSAVDTLGYSINGQTLQLRLSKNPHVYNVSFSDNSLDLAIAEINTVLGYTAASKGGSGSDQIKVSSQLKGLGASIECLQSAPAVAFGLNTSAIATSPAVSTTATGSGRPLPDAYLDSSNNLVVGAQVVRDQVTGYPLDQTTSGAVLYIQYKALRHDVTAIAIDAGVLRISDSDMLSEVLNPLTEDNPLGLGVFLCMLNAPKFEVKALGVDAVDSKGNGTAAAYLRAAAMLESEEVYAIAPMSQDPLVRDLWLTHALAMSAPEQGGERIVFFNNSMPTEKNAAVAASGTAANSTATANQLLLDSNPAAGLVTAGKNPAQPFAYADGVYIEFTDPTTGTFYRYLATGVSGTLVNFTKNFASGQNVDGFYTTAAMPTTVINASWSLKVRGASLTVPGSNPARLDYSLVSSTVSDQNAAVKNRRGYSVFPDTCVVTINGVDKTLPGYYACAAIAGMVASQPAQQGFTNFPVGGIKAVVGTERFSKKQLNVMAGGGTYILIQDAPGASVVCRQQVSTDTTSTETRELSITKVVDFVAKFLRLGVRKFIGTQNVNKDLLDSIGTTVQGLLAFLEERGVLNGSNLNQIIQASDAKDTILLDVTLDVPYPCNYIKLTLVV